MLRRYIETPPDGTPNIGKITLGRLTVEDVQAFYTSLRKDQGLSPATIRSVHAIIRPALRYATKTGAVARNVADLVELPKMQKRKVEAMSREEAEGFLGAARDDRYYALWCVLLTGGLRPGEALALQWDDLDLDAAKIHIQRTLTRRGVEGWVSMEPKTERSRRVVVLPDFAVRALRAHRKTQAEERLLLGAEYENNGFVFATEFGRPLDSTNLYSRNFRRIMQAAGLGTVTKVKTAKGREKDKFVPKYRLYDLRHTAATLLLRAGENPKVVSERLGHASVAFTMDVYAASLPDLQEGAAEKMETLFGESA